VQVHAEGFTAGETVIVAEAVDNGMGRIFTQQATISSTGTLDMAVVAHAQIRTNGGSAPFFQTHDCNGTCSLDVTNGSNETASEPLNFVANVAILHPTVIASPATGLHDGASVHVHVPGGYFDLGQSVGPVSFADATTTTSPTTTSSVAPVTAQPAFTG
jgi:hypothetical protein